MAEGNGLLKPKVTFHKSLKSLEIINNYNELSPLLNYQEIPRNNVFLRMSGT